MKREIALRELNQRADALRAMGATSLYLFGSTVRDEAAEGSDIDLFIDYDRDSRFSLLDLVGIKLFLEDELHLPIDVTTRDSLHPLLSERIQQDAVRVF
ncbi:MAG: nucleotidyltransferase domain-containing protein [Beijerinckiaceae bacterium]|nr:nucleotidyltransferase domain-containing protein [Beijerinckiaceae bacterium]